MKESGNSNFYNAACVFALAAASIKPDDGDKLTAEQSKQRQTWIDESMATLKQSIEAGWDDFDHMRADTDLTILRKLPEFKAFGKTTTSKAKDE